MNAGRDDVLVQIVESVQERLAQERAPADLEQRAREAASARRREGRRSLEPALAAPGVRIIAECKRRSPSRGVLRQPFDAAQLARSYQAVGAAAISVVTEPAFFDGRIEWVAAVRAATRVPILQKDFLIAPRQLYEAVLVGADAVLLIVRILPGTALADLISLSGELGLDALVEVHDTPELERARLAGARLVGVNSRDLRTFAVDLAGAAEIALRVSGDVISVIESGVTGRADVERLGALGLRRFLVGEHLLRAVDPGAALAALLGTT